MVCVAAATFPARREWENALFTQGVKSLPDFLPLNQQHTAAGSHVPGWLAGLEILKQLGFELLLFLGEQDIGVLSIPPANDVPACLGAVVAVLDTDLRQPR